MCIVKANHSLVGFDMNAKITFLSGGGDALKGRTGRGDEGRKRRRREEGRRESGREEEEVR